MSKVAPAGIKRPTNLSLDEKLVREARTYTPNLSATLEQLLADYVERERRRRREEDTALNDLIDAFNALHERTGLLSDEFSAL